MVKRLALVFVWLLVAPALLASLIAITLAYQQESQSAAIAEFSAPQNTLEGQVLGTEVSDLRPYLIEKVLQKTVLEPYSFYMVEIADKYGIDYRLIPAIAMKESGGGNKARTDSHNAWGFENGRTNFESWESAIDTVGKTLKERYVAKGLTTPEQIMPVYAPPQVLTGGKWATDVNFFFRKMESL